MKAGLGATVLDIGMADEDSARRAAEALRTARGLDPIVEGTTVELNVDDGPASGVRGAARAPGQRPGSCHPRASGAEPRRRVHRAYGTGTDTDAEPNGGDAKVAAPSRRRHGDGHPSVFSLVFAGRVGTGQAGSVRWDCEWLVLDTFTVTKRNLIAYTRIPEAMFFSSVQPIMFVLLFRYVFGGAIRTPGFSYVDYMMPGIFVQTVRSAR